MVVKKDQLPDAYDSRHPRNAAKKNKQITVNSTDIFFNSTMIPECVIIGLWDWKEILSMVIICYNSNSYSFHKPAKFIVLWVSWILYYNAFVASVSSIFYTCTLAEFDTHFKYHIQQSQLHAFGTWPAITTLQRFTQATHKGSQFILRMITRRIPQGFVSLG